MNDPLEGPSPPFPKGYAVTHLPHKPGGTDVKVSPFLPLMVWLLGLVMGVLLGAMVATSAWRTDAVKQGKAEWGVSDAGNVTWRWKP